MRRVSILLWGALACTSLCSAEVINFADSKFNWVNGNSSVVMFQGQWNEFTMTALPGKQVVNGGWTTIPAATLTQDSDGIGVNRKDCGTIGGLTVCGKQDANPDEVESPELLKINFAHTVHLESFNVSDLFGDSFLGIYFGEKGRYDTNVDPNYTYFYGTPNGEVTVPVGEDITELLLTTDTQLRDTFALRSINVTPEPTSIVLLGTALLGVGTVLRKRFSRAA